jgi:hypothetical protein
VASYDEAAFKSFLNRYPTGALADQVRSRLPSQLLGVVLFVVVAVLFLDSCRDLSLICDSWFARAARRHPQGTRYVARASQ